MALVAHRMDHAKIIHALERFGRILPPLVAGLSDEDARWRPGEGHWSILEVVMHLCDEEVDDFRTRLRLTLEDPSQPWPRIDPSGWAVERRYNEANMNQAVDRFVRERSASVEWLRSLANPDFNKAYQHPKIGPIRAGDLLASWPAHDALHLRQVAKRLHQLAARDGGEFTTRYAGEW